METAFTKNLNQEKKFPKQHWELIFACWHHFLAPWTPFFRSLGAIF